MRTSKTVVDTENWLTYAVELANDVEMDFKVYQIVGRSCDDTEIKYVRADSERGQDFTNNLAEAQVYCSGYIKWDGCCNVQFDEQSRCMLHFCGNPSEQMMVLFDRLYELAAELMPDHAKTLKEW